MWKPALALALVFGLLPVGAAEARTLRFQARLTGAAEAPAVRTRASGHAVVILDTRRLRLSYTVVYAGLSGGPLEYAHLHDLDNPREAVDATVIMQPGPSPIRGAARLTRALAADLEHGRWYVNLHTRDHEDGEIRGPLVPAP